MESLVATPNSKAKQGIPYQLIDSSYRGHFFRNRPTYKIVWSICKKRSLQI